MKTIELKGAGRLIAERSSEKSRALKEIRKNDGVPCVVYGGKENIHFTVESEALRHLVYTPDIYLVYLEVDGLKMTVILKEIQFHPVSDKILHIDFLEVSATKPIVIAVPVRLDGLAEGVKSGGKLVLQMRKLSVRALYKNIPERLVIDVSSLTLGKTIKVSEVSFDGLELLDVKDNVICAVKLTRAAKGLAATTSDSDKKE
ncbi:50S ribosomal protein L25 [termite gut metagenome]|uniref:50S ribosomal protein L25 n=1 Tax=termite gut metagenome TaxID=433724 RepID=A0A5J4SCP8_9ZZZZ